MKPFFQTPAEGARTAIFLATDDSVKDISGEYFYKCKIAKSSKRSKDMELAKRLYEFSEELIECENLMEPGKRMMESAIKRVTEYEKLLCEAEALLDNYSDENFDVLRTIIEALETYYASEEWRNDFEADEAGLFPDDLKRGVLSEDGIYNVLERFHELERERKAEQCMTNEEVLEKLKNGEGKVEYNTRPVTIDDYDALFELWNATEQSRRALNPVDDSREGIERYLKRNPNTCFAAVAEGRIIGVILTGHDGRRGIIHHMCIHPDYRRLGIAGRLVSEAEEALKKEGIQKVFGLVFKDNDPANAFWEAQGYSLRTNLNYRNKSLNADIPTGE